MFFACAQTFLLKVTKRNMDGTTSLVKSVPCGGVDSYTCLVEVSPSRHPHDLMTFNDCQPSTMSTNEIRPVSMAQRCGRLRGGAISPQELRMPLALGSHQCVQVGAFFEATHWSSPTAAVVPFYEALT